MKRTPLKRTQKPLLTRKPLSKGKGLKKISKAGKVKKKAKNELMSEMIEMFKEIWDERPHNCTVTGRYLGWEPLTTFFHHLLPKGENQYPEYTLCKWNIIIVSPGIHNRIEMDLSSVPIVYKLTQDLIKRHKNNELSCEEKTTY